MQEDVDVSAPTLCGSVHGLHDLAIIAGDDAQSLPCIFCLLRARSAIWILFLRVPYSSSIARATSSAISSFFLFSVLMPYSAAIVYWSRR